MLRYKTFEDSVREKMHSFEKPFLSAQAPGENHRPEKSISDVLKSYSDEDLLMTSLPLPLSRSLPLLLLLSLTALCVSRAETTLTELLGATPNPTANPPIEK